MADQCPSSSHISGPPESPWNKAQPNWNVCSTIQHQQSLDIKGPRLTPTWQLSTPPSEYPAHNMLEVMLYCGNQRWHWSWGSRGTSASWRMSGRFSARQADILFHKYVKMFVSLRICLCLTVSVSSPSGDKTFLSHCVVLSFRWQTQGLDVLWKKNH